MATPRLAEAGGRDGGFRPTPGHPIVCHGQMHEMEVDFAALPGSRLVPPLAIQRPSDRPAWTDHSEQIDIRCGGEIITGERPVEHNLLEIVADAPWSAA